MSIGEKAFGYCSSLPSVIIPNGVTFIEKGAFSGCNNLKSVIFGNSLSTIAEDAFDKSYPLNMVLYTTISAPEGAIYGNNNYVPNITNYDQSQNICPIMQLMKSTYTYGETITQSHWLCSLLDFSAIVNTSQLDFNAGNHEGFCNVDIKTDGFESTIEVPYAYSIEKKGLNINVDNKEKVYGDDNPELTYSYEGFVNNENESVLSTKPLIATEANKLSPIGQYAIIAKDAEARNYDIHYSNGSLSINKAHLLVSALDKTKTYGKVNPDLTVSYEGFVNDENENVFATKPVVSTVANELSHVGQYEIKVSGAEAQNYDIQYKNGTLTITKAPLYATVGDVTKVYGEENPNFTISYEGLIPTDAGIVSLTPITYTTEATKQSGAGLYTVSASGASFKNYDVVEYNAGTLTINKAPLSITACDASRLYFDDDPQFDFVCTGLVNDDTKESLLQSPTFTTSSNKNSNVGIYIIMPSDAKSDNYELSYASGQLTISTRPLTVQPADVFRYYGEDNPQWQFVYDGFVNNESDKDLTTKPSASTSASALSGVGEYAIVPSGAEAQNYDMQYINGTLTIAKAPLHAIVGDATKVYGTENPNFTISYDGLIPTDAGIASLTPITYTTEATKQSGVGQYAVSASGASFKNYDVVDYTDGTLTISQAALVVKANDASRLYFDDDPEFTFTCTGFVNGDDEKCLSQHPTFTTSSQKDSSVGVYSITPSSASSANYEFAYESGKLTINKRDLKAKVTNMYREYGDDNPTFQIQYDGFVNNETEDNLTSIPVLSCSATPKSGIGDYDIKISGGSATNYEITCENGILSVVKAPLQIYVDDCTKVYGDNNPSFTCRYEGLKNGETKPAWTTTPTYSTEATTISDVGDYAIKLLNGVAKNYDVTYNDGTLTIDKAQLTVKAVNKSRLYYEDNPTFTYTCSGFKNYDNEEVFIKKPSLECPATISSNAGEYVISALDAECKNYSISYEEGKLMINKRTLNVHPNDFSRKYAEENPEFTYAITGFVNNENINVLLHQPVAYTNATSTTDVGTYPIYAKDAEAENYSFNYKQGVLTIEKADQTITWNQDFNGIRVGDQVELLATTSSGLPVQYVFDTDIVTMYTAGHSFYLDCLTEGSFSIRATQSGNRNYNPAVRIAKTITIYEADGIHAVMAESYIHPVYFDMSGVRVEVPQKGRYYIRVDNGELRKVLMK